MNSLVVHIYVTRQISRVSVFLLYRVSNCLDCTYQFVTTQSFPMHIRQSNYQGTHLYIVCTYISSYNRLLSVLSEWSKMEQMVTSIHEAEQK